MDPHVFADPDPGIQNPVDPTDPDLKHCLMPEGCIFSYHSLVFHECLC